MGGLSDVVLMHRSSQLQPFSRPPDPDAPSCVCCSGLSISRRCCRVSCTGGTSAPGSPAACKVNAFPVAKQAPEERPSAKNGKRISKMSNICATHYSTSAGVRDFLYCVLNLLIKREILAA